LSISSKLSTCYRHENVAVAKRYELMNISTHSEEEDIFLCISHLHESVCIAGECMDKQPLRIINGFVQCHNGIWMNMRQVQTIYTWDTGLSNSQQRWSIRAFGADELNVVVGAYSSEREAEYALQLLIRYTEID
jgi:hypothetical protein